MLIQRWLVAALLLASAARPAGGQGAALTPKPAGAPTGTIKKGTGRKQPE